MREIREEIAMGTRTRCVSLAVNRGPDIEE